MSTYAILGATGNVGNTVLQVLSEDSSRRINVLVRSKQKLEKMSPEICSSSNVTIFQGNIDDRDTLQKCITSTRAVFLTVAAPNNIPKCRISQNQAEAVVNALTAIRKSDPHARLPTLVMLSSAEAEEIPKLSASIPWPFRNILFAANSFIYHDLIAAEKYLRSQDDWISSVFVKPGGLGHDKRTGHKLSTEQSQTPISYSDLAAGMVEIAETDGDKWVGKCVSILVNEAAAFPWYMPPLLLKGLFVHFFPGFYSWVY